MLPWNNYITQRFIFFRLQKTSHVETCSSSQSNNMTRLQPSLTLSKQSICANPFVKLKPVQSGTLDGELPLDSRIRRVSMILMNRYHNAAKRSGYATKCLRSSGTRDGTVSNTTWVWSIETVIATTGVGYSWRCLVIDFHHSLRYTVVYPCHDSTIRMKISDLNIHWTLIYTTRYLGWKEGHVWIFQWIFQPYRFIPNLNIIVTGSIFAIWLFLYKIGQTHRIGSVLSWVIFSVQSRFILCN